MRRETQDMRQDPRAKMNSGIKFMQQMEFVIRLLGILEKPVTVYQIANKVGLSGRSVYRWIGHLREMGFVVEDEKGWFCIKDGNYELAKKTVLLKDLCCK